MANQEPPDTELSSSTTGAQRLLGNGAPLSRLFPHFVGELPRPEFFSLERLGAGCSGGQSAVRLGAGSLRRAVEEEGEGCDWVVLAVLCAGVGFWRRAAGARRFFAER